MLCDAGADREANQADPRAYAPRRSFTPTHSRPHHGADANVRLPRCRCGGPRRGHGARPSSATGCDSSEWASCRKAAACSAWLAAVGLRRARAPWRWRRRPAGALGTVGGAGLLRDHAARRSFAVCSRAREARPACSTRGARNPCGRCSTSPRRLLGGSARHTITGTLRAG